MTGHARDEIARLERQIDDLADGIERCRKIDLASKTALAVGVIWLVLTVLAILPPGVFNLAGAMATILGGIVVFGSNSSTWKQSAARRARAEAERAALIDLIDPRVVGDGNASERL